MSGLESKYPAPITADQKTILCETLRNFVNLCGKFKYDEQILTAKKKISDAKNAKPPTIQKHLLKYHQIPNIIKTILCETLRKLHQPLR